MLSISGIEADYDDEMMSVDEAVTRLGAAGVLGIVYTSPSHSEDAPRWRVLCPLSQEYTPDERDRFLARLNGLFGGIFANESWTRSQSYYYGSVNQNPSHRAESIEGTPIDLISELDMFAIRKPEKPKPNGAHHGPATPPAEITDKRINGLIQSLLNNIRNAVDGTKYFTLRDTAFTIGGYLHLTTWSVQQAVEACVAALPGAEDWEAARKTATAAVEAGAAKPLDLADRPEFKARGKSNGAYAPDVPPVGDPIPPPVGLPEPPEPPDPPDVPPVGDADGPGDAPPLPTIECRAGELPRMIREVQEALVGSGVAIYQRGMLVQPIEQQYTAADGSMTHSAALVPLSAPALIKLFTEAARFEKWDMRVNGGAGGWRAIDPPDRLVQIVLHNRSGWPFPVVRGVLTCPTLRPDGSILRDPGYDPISRYYLMFPDGLTVPDIASAPTKADAAAALGRLKDLISSYPFNSKASRSVGLAMLMTQVLRCAMPVSPMLAVSARAPGTGKSHLVDLCSMVAIGRLCPIMGTGKNDEEAEKRINTMLLAGVPGFSIDNVHRDLDLDTLNQATERPMISIRVFGALEKVEVENSVVVYMTGNNLAVVDEQGRRTLRCELDAGVERPERRHFDGDPIYTARDKRGEYIADVLTIARAYHTGGDKPDLFPLGSYGAWSHFVREPLVWLGEADPAETMEETEHDDPATIRLRAIISGWYFSFTLQPKTLADAVRDAQPEFRDTMKEHFPARGGIEVDTTKMGNWLRKFGGRIIDGMRFVKEDGHTGGTIRWKISLIV
jgi:putative DNA primase/helicase